MSRGYSRWEDAMISQQRILEWYRSEMGLRYLVAFMDDMNAKHTPNARVETKLLAAIQVKTLLEAEPVWVAPEAIELVDHARTSFEPEPLVASDPFVPNGFALFSEPLIMHDAPQTEKNWGRSPTGEFPVRALAWMAVHSEDLSMGCFWLSLYVDIDDELALNPTDNRWVESGYFGGMRDEDLDYMRRVMPLSLVHQYQWSWGKRGWENPNVTEDEDRQQSLMRAREQAQLPQVFWRIASQFTALRAQVPRQMRRDFRRKGGQFDEVTVITLRRGRQPGEHEPTGRELTVQHLVRGYWATRHTREGPRQVWVRPHVKGGDHLPFKETTRAWEFRR